MMARCAVSALLLIALLAGCDKPKSDYSETLYVFGTLVEIVLPAAEEDAARAAVAGIARDFDRMHTDWHAWKPGEMSRLNEAFANGETMTVSPFLLPLLAQAKTYEAGSGGLFNPAIGGLIGLWGFHADTPPENAPIPEAAEIAAWVMQRPSMADVIIDGDRVHSSNPAVRLDFGGFAKGEAVGRAIAALRRAGFADAVVNAGGGLMVIGHPEPEGNPGRPWKVGIRHPAHWGAIASVALKDGEAMMTSGNYERFRIAEGIHYGHIIDPRDGMPVAEVVSVSVIHGDPALADAASTALTVAGAKDWPRVARAMGIKDVLLVTADGAVQGTPSMLARTTFEGERPARVEEIPLP